MERRAGGGRGAGRDGRQLAFPLRPGAVAGVAAIPLFLQATDTRPAGAAARREYGRAPGSASGGSTSAYDLFEENLRYFPALLPICDEEDPQRVLSQGGIPGLAELVLHNGTVYRWNRPVYAVDRRRPASPCGEPRPARRAHRDRRTRQHRPLLRPGAQPRRRAAPGLVAAARSPRRPPTSTRPAGTASTPN